MNLAMLDELQLPPAVIIAATVLLSTIVMYLIKRFLLARVKRLVATTSLHIDTLLLESLQAPLNILILLVNLLLFERLLNHFHITNADLSRFSSMSAQLLLVLAIVLFVDRFSNGALTTYTTKSEALRSSSGIIKGIVRGLVIGIGALVLLGTLGISITPIIASLGITSLAVALALQPTLENFFSGVQLVVDKPIRVGDYIELDSGEQGFVERIGWRSTWIKMLPNNVVIMPNSVLSQSKIINYYYPQKELSVPVEVGVHYSSDLEHVERVTLEVAREILRSHKWGVPDYETFVVFHTFDSSSINFTVMLRAQEYFNRFFIKSEFIKALHKRYAKEGIVIPYPIRAINTDQENPAFSIKQ
ncbi:mechanosensitive ion channel-like protein [Alteromonadaceae bacterium 2753L.S.0a.02]|nr:mechanosensitive ion channel-like protein [Alteromonadaceae bacterium 2753L.S.0a.02]